MVQTQTSKSFPDFVRCFSFVCYYQGTWWSHGRVCILALFVPQTKHWIFFIIFLTKSDFSLSGSFAKNRGHFHLNDCTYLSVYLTIQHCRRHNGPEGWVHITSPTQILIKLQFRNLDKALNLKSQLNINISSKLKLKILTKPSFKISTKIFFFFINLLGEF